MVLHQHLNHDLIKLDFIIKLQKKWDIEERLVDNKKN